MVLPVLQELDHLHLGGYGQQFPYTIEADHSLQLFCQGIPWVYQEQIFSICGLQGLFTGRALWGDIAELFCAGNLIEDLVALLVWADRVFDDVTLDSEVTFCCPQG